MRSPRRWIVPTLILIACAAAYVVHGRRPQRSYGSTSLIDAPVIAPDATADEVLDVAVEYTFPASDPISVEVAYRKRGR